jgi:hypothetical protein
MILFSFSKEKGMAAVGEEESRSLLRSMPSHPKWKKKFFQYRD